MPKFRWFTIGTSRLRGRFFPNPVIPVNQPSTLDATMIFEPSAK